MTTIKIQDCGTYVEASVDASGMTVAMGGGCQVERIIGHLSYSPRRKIAGIARDVIEAWMEGYEGDPHDCGLNVEIIRGEESLKVAA